MGVEKEEEEEEEWKKLNSNWRCRRSVRVSNFYIHKSQSRQSDCCNNRTTKQCNNGCNIGVATEIRGFLTLFSASHDCQS